MRTERTTTSTSAVPNGVEVETEGHALGALAAELSAAATPDEVAHALVERLPPLLGAVGGALGLVQGEELVIVDPGGVRRATLPARLRLPLDALAPIAQAARTGAPVFANSREDFERDFPDGARLAVYAQGALAVPLVSKERVVGSMGFPFDAAGCIDAQLVALAQLAAALGGQALERSQLYDRERSLREGLDRIARLAPRFAGERTEAVMEAVCREALATFDGRVAQLWALAGDEAVLVHQEPPDVDYPPGTRSSRSELTGLEESLTRKAPVFAEAPPTEGPIDSAAPFRLVGGRHALQIPIVVAGDVGRMLRVIWSAEAPTDRPETLVLARRLADHAGLALEHAERRRAQEAASRSASETRRLLDVTEALGAATTPELVGAAALEEALTTLGASAGAFLRLTGDECALLAWSGYTADEVAGWERFARSARAPLAAAVTKNEVIVHPSLEELAVDFPEIAAVTRHGAWLSIPLSVGGVVIGAVGLSFAEGRTFRPGDLEYVDSLARQAALALDRTLLLEDEQRARVRAEQLAGDLSRLHAFATSLGSASSTSEIGALLCEQVKAVLGAGACAIYEPNGGDRFQLLHGSSATSRDESSVDDVPWPHSLEAALNPSGSLWLATEDDWRSSEPYEVLRTTDAPAVAVVPLAAGGQPIGMLVSWFSRERFPEDSGKRLLETMVRQATQPLARVRLLESERLARLDAQTAAERTRTLYVVADRMSVAVTPADVADVLSSSLQGLLAADVVEVFKLDDGRRRAQLLASTGGAPGELVWLDEPELTLPRDDRPPDEGASGRYLFLLTSGLRTPGVVRVSFDTPVLIDDESASMIQTITRQGGQALDRSLLYDEELLARTRTERLQALTAAFSSSLTLADVAAVFVEDARVGLSAEGVFLGTTGSDERELRALAWRGYPDDAVSHLLAVSSTHDTPVVIAAREGGASYFETATQLGARYPELIAPLAAIGHETFAFLPVRAGARPFGVAILSWRGQAELDDDAWSFLQVLTTQCGLALDRAERYEGERSVAETLQRSVLPRSLPVLEGVRVAARYLPGTSALDVGGDWFDTLMLPDGRLGFAVGDVVGKGVTAAATMAQLRNGMRALTLDESDPSRTMTKLNRLLDGITDAPFATVAYLTLDPKTRAATLVSAGHLPPLVIEPSGTTRFLEEGRNLPLGVDADVPLEGAPVQLQPGSLVILYTDGLVERVERSIDDGLERLAAVTVPAERDPEQVADAIVHELLGDERLRDDVALLVLELAPATSPLELTLPADGASLRPLRAEVAEWLEREHVLPVDARDILLAVWEAATNAVEHGSRDGGTVSLSASIVGDRVRIDVTDDGRWQEPRARENRGLGLRVIRSLMTEVELDHSERGTRVRMERSLSTQPAWTRDDKSRELNG